MAKDKLTVDDFAVAPRRKRSTGKTRSAEVGPSQEESTVAAKQEVPSDMPTDNVDDLKVRPRDESETRAIVETRKSKQEAAASRLLELRAKRNRELKYYVNVPLDYATKKRLERAAQENDLKMTVIMKDAIDRYLSDAGY